MVNLKKLLMISTALVMPTTAYAAPVTAFFAGLGFAGGTTAAVASALFPGAFAVGQFLTGTLGSILLNVGVSALITALSRPKAPSIEAARVNTRLPDATRWQAGGKTLVGGEAGVFGEYDADGNFWYIVTHADGEIVGTPQYYFDGIPVDLDVDGYVTTDEFCTTDSYAKYEGTGNKKLIWRIFTITPDASNLYGALPADFTTAFPSLPADFYLAGVAYSLIRCEAVPLQHYNKVYRFRGPFGLSEPAVTVYANFNRMYDPRDVGHDINDPDTWTASDGNPAIIWAWFRTNPRGRNRPMSEVDWAQVALEADKCDALVLDYDSNSIPIYRCGVAFPDNKPRHQCEREILSTFDAIVVYSDDGRAWPSGGFYQAPTIEMTKKRDIFSAQTEVVDDGESAVDGVVVNYLSQDHDFTKQQSALWKNPNYYDGVSEPNFVTIDILGVQNHNQAFRLAKANGLRLAATKRAALGTTIKGLLLKDQRNFTLDWDAQFSGDFEIVSPVQTDASGQACSFGVVPMQSTRWTLGPGEEEEPPQPSPELNIDDGLAFATNVVVTLKNFSFSRGEGVRFEATFDLPSRADRFYKFRYAPTGTTDWQYFSVDMDDGFAFSAILSDGAVYDIQWQTSSANREGSWLADQGGGETVLTLTAVANQTAPGDLVSFDAADGAGGKRDFLRNRKR